MLGAPLAYSQEVAQAGSAAGGAGAGSAASGAGLASASDQASGETGVSRFVGSLIPGFQFGARVNLAETYATNASGSSAAGARSDWLTIAGVGLTMNEHSARVSLDANYSGMVSFYANGTQSTQFTNDLQAAATVVAIPDYVNFRANAFAQPVVISNVGFVTANGNLSSNGYRNSYGFSAGPDITFRLGSFASSITSATYGASYFTEPAGSSFTGIPGVLGPQNTTMRSFSEKLVSGPDFSRLNWSAVAMMQEMDRPQGLFSEKAALGHFQFAITREIALLGTGGYDFIHNTIPLGRDLSGPVGTGGIALTLGEDFLLQFEVGQKYNDISYQGSLRWNIGPTAVLTGSATDTITTPEGQMLDNLSSLVSTSGGGLASSSALYANGTAATLSSFSAQQSGSLTYNQNISRYQRLSLAYSQDFARDHANVEVFAMRQTVLDRIFVGQPVNNSWGVTGSIGHDLSRLMIASVGAGYSNYEEFGGHASIYNVNGALTYTLSPDTSVYLRTDYMTRDSSQSLQSLSPFTGNTDDLRVSIGLSHTL